MAGTIGKRTAFTLAAALAAAPVAHAAAQDAVGNWVGPLQVTPDVRLPLIVHIERDEAGTLGGTMDSPTQGVRGMPLDGVAAEAGSLSFEVPSIGGSYAGQWDAEAKLWRGEWKQAGMTWPLVLIIPPPPQPLPADWQLPSDEEIGRLIAERNAPRPGQGIVVGVLEPDGERFVSGGTDVAATVDRNTLYEIGSISKVFTALILADMVNKGEVSLDDPAEKYLPAGHRMPQRGGRQITLRDLSTHTSGLPRMAADMGAADGVDDPFVDYGEDKLLAFLDGYQLTRDVGERWEYSNLAVGLLGYLLGRAADSDYETLLRERITGPLGMNDTLIALPPDKAARLAPPFDRYMRPGETWDMTLFAPAGGIRSSAADMLIFAKAVLDPGSPIAAAVKTTLSVREPIPDNPNAEQALGWQVLHPGPGRDVLMHGGQTGSYQTILALEPVKGRAVVALANSQAAPGPEDLALHMLTGRRVTPTPPVPAAPSVRAEIALPVEALDKFVGRYQMDFFGYAGVVAITRVGTTLRAQRADVPGAPALPIYPEAPQAFFWKAVDAQIRFVTDAGGAVTGAELSQGGATFIGARMEN